VRGAGAVLRLELVEDAVLKLVEDAVVVLSATCLPNAKEL